MYYRAFIYALLSYVTFAPAKAFLFMLQIIRVSRPICHAPLSGLLFVRLGEIIPHLSISIRMLNFMSVALTRFGDRPVSESEIL